MIQKSRWCWVLLGLLATTLSITWASVLPVSAIAGHCHRGCGRCGACAQPLGVCGCPRPVCGRCRKSLRNCCCPPPAMPLPVVMPQPATILQPQQVTMMQPVTQTAIRREARVVDVPVTINKKVVVDEGSYQTVWVPKLTTKIVSETAVQKQVRYEDVPYQVVQQVPVQQTRLVPTTVTAFAPQPQIGVASCCPHHHHQGVAAISNPVMGAPVMGMISVPVPAPVSAGLVESPTATAMATPDHHEHLHTEANEAPLAQESSKPQWTKVPTRMSSSGNVELQAYEYEEAVPVSQPRSATISVPTAAAAWRAAGAFSRR